MQRRRYKQTEPLLKIASHLSLGRTERKPLSFHLGRSARNALLKKARLADTGSHLEGWANSPALQPPK